MGYELHITRAELHWENAESVITQAEWLEEVAADPELKLAGYNGPTFALWTAHPADSEAWLDWSQGNISTKHPDDALTAKMLEIATRLGATVQGDDGETYPVISENRGDFWETFAGRLSLIVVVLGVGAAATAIAIDERGPLRGSGESRSLGSTIALLVLIFPGIVGWIGGTAIALLTCLAPSRERFFAWAALAISVGAVVCLRFLN